MAVSSGFGPSDHMEHNFKCRLQAAGTENSLQDSLKQSIQQSPGCLKAQDLQNAKESTETVSGETIRCDIQNRHLHLDILPTPKQGGDETLSPKNDVFVATRQMSNQEEINEAHLESFSVIGRNRAIICILCMVFVVHVISV